MENIFQSSGESKHMLGGRRDKLKTQAGCTMRDSGWKYQEMPANFGNEGRDGGRKTANYGDLVTEEIIVIFQESLKTVMS